MEFREDGRSANDDLAVEGREVDSVSEAVYRVDRRSQVLFGTQYRGAEQAHDIDVYPPNLDRHRERSLPNIASAAVSVSDATWSITTRSRPASSVA